MRYRFFDGGEIMCPRCMGREFAALPPDLGDGGEWVTVLVCEACHSNASKRELREAIGAKDGEVTSFLEGLS